MVKNIEYYRRINAFLCFCNSFSSLSRSFIMDMFQSLPKSRGKTEILVKYWALERYTTHLSSWLRSTETCSCFHVCHYQALDSVSVYMMWGGGGGFIRCPPSSCCSICKVWSVIIPSHYSDLESWAWGAHWDPPDNRVTRRAVENTNT